MDDDEIELPAIVLDGSRRDDDAIVSEVGMDDDAMQLSAIVSEVRMDDDAMQLSPGPWDAGGPSMDLGKVSQDNVLFHEYCSEFERGLLRWAQAEPHISDREVWLPIKLQLLHIQIDIVKRRCGAKQNFLTVYLSSILELGSRLYEAEQDIETEIESFSKFRTRLFTVVSTHCGLQTSLEPADKVLADLISRITKLRQGWRFLNVTAEQHMCRQQVSALVNPLLDEQKELDESVKEGTISTDTQMFLLREKCGPLFKNLKDKLEDMLTEWEQNELFATQSAKFALIILGLSTIGHEYCRSKPEMPDLDVMSELHPDGTPPYNNIAFYRDIFLWGDLLQRESVDETKLHSMNPVNYCIGRWEQISQTIASVTDRDACSVVEFSDNYTKASDLMTKWAWSLRSYRNDVSWLFPAFQAASFLHDVWRLNDVFFCRANYTPDFNLGECAWTLCRVLADLQIMETWLQKNDAEVNVEVLRLAEQTGGWCRFVEDLVRGVVRKEVRALGAEERAQKMVDCLIKASSMVSSGTGESTKYDTIRLKIEGLPGHLQQGGPSRVFYKIAQVQNDLRELCNGYEHPTKDRFDFCKDLWSLALCCECFLGLNRSMNPNRSPTGSVLLVDGDKPPGFNWVAELREGIKELKGSMDDFKRSGGSTNSNPMGEAWSRAVRPRLSRTIQLLA